MSRAVSFTDSVSFWSDERMPGIENAGLARRLPHRLRLPPPPPFFGGGGGAFAPAAGGLGGGIGARGRPPQQVRVVLEPALTQVARVAEQLAHELSAVIVVDAKPAPARFLAADVAATPLLLEEAIVVLDCHPVAALEAAFPVRYCTSLVELRVCVPPQ